MTGREEQPQPKDLDTGERLATTGRAVVQGMAHEARGEHETEPGARHRLDSTEVEWIIDDRVPPERFDDIAQFDGSILLDRTRGEVAARCDSEAANVLGMNMVHEIVTGKRSVADARETAAQNTVAYNLGRAAPYAEQLLFEVPQGDTEDLDESMISGAIVQQTAGKIKDVLSGSHEEATERRTGTRTAKRS